MLQRVTLLFAIVGLLIGLVVMPTLAQDKMKGDRMMSGMSSMHREVVSAWPAKSQEVANSVIAKYGPPDEATATMLVWHNKGPWKRTVVYRDVVMHQFPMPHPD
ncbi:MAG: hypothetical protein LC776_18365, partial [Acidobacteria bacterium]|nr:hypothetical protein [Acidobacteriota bacterium]